MTHGYEDASASIVLMQRSDELPLIRKRKDTAM